MIAKGILFVLFATCMLAAWVHVNRQAEYRETDRLLKQAVQHGDDNARRILCNEWYPAQNRPQPKECRP